MKNLFLPALLLGVAGMSSCAHTQDWQQDNSWGEPVNGVQLRLALSSSGPPAIPGELPAFEVQIRNRGSKAIAFGDELFHPHIEIDGIWYAQPYAIFGSSVVIIEPGSRSDMYRVSYNAAIMFELDASSSRPFKLLPGPHRIRVRGVSEGRLILKRAADGKSVNGESIELVSNRIAIDIPELSAAAERPKALARRIVATPY